jgi:hypothetical protein
LLQSIAKKSPTAQTVATADLALRQGLFAKTFSKDAQMDIWAIKYDIILGREA